MQDERQIETQCITQLGWSVEQVAEATPEDMCIALQKHKKQRKSRTASSTTAAHKKAVHRPSSLPSSTAPPVSIFDQYGAGEPLQEEGHIVSRLRSIVLRKTNSIPELHQEDVDLLRKSIQRDQARLDLEVEKIRETIQTCKSEQRKKLAAEKVLEAVLTEVPNDIDASHLAKVRVQLKCSKEKVEALTALLAGC